MTTQYLGDHERQRYEIVNLKDMAEKNSERSLFSPVNSSERFVAGRVCPNHCIALPGYFSLAVHFIRIVALEYVEYVTGCVVDMAESCHSMVPAWYGSYKL